MMKLKKKKSGSKANLYAYEAPKLNNGAFC